MKIQGALRVLEPLGICAFFRALTILPDAGILGQLFKRNNKHIIHMTSHENWTERLAHFFMDRYRISVLLLVAVVLAGIWGITSNQRQDFPKIPINIIVVSAVYPGASPVDVEQAVLVPIEQAAQNIDGVTKVRSTAASNFGSVVATLENTQQVSAIAATLSDELGKLSLPAGVETNVETIDAAGVSMALGIVSADGRSVSEMLEYASAVKTRLEASSDQLKKIDIIPDNTFSVEIQIDTAAFVASGLTFDTVKGAVQSYITSIPGGSISMDDGSEQTITISAAAQTIDDLAAVPLGTLTLGDLATITRTPNDATAAHFIGYTTEAGSFAREAVYLLAYKKDSGDIITLSEDLRAEFTEIKDDKIIPEGMDIVIAYDNAPYVQDQLSSLLQNGLYGLILVALVLLLFIDLRTSLLVAAIIPLTFLVTIFVLPVIGFSLNILTLFGMIFTLGIIVDNAIVIAQGIKHEIERGVTKREAALISVRKFGPAVTASTLTTVVAFIPFAFLGGIIGDFLKFIPYTVIIMLGASYLMAICITPLLGSWMLKQQTYDQRRQATIKDWEKALVLPALIHRIQNFVDWMARGYGRLMHWIYAKMSRMVLTVVLTVVLLGVSIGVFAPQLKFEQFPTTDSDVMQVNYTFPVTMTLERQKEILQQSMDMFVALPYFQTFYFFDNVVYANFAKPADRPDGKTIHQISDQFNADVAAIVESAGSGVAIESSGTSYGPPSSAYDLEIEFLGSDRTALSTAADDIQRFLDAYEGVSKTTNSTKDLLVPSVQVELDEAKLAAAGVNPLIAAGTVNALFAPQKVGSATFREDGVSDDVTIRFGGAGTDSIDGLKGLPIPAARGIVPLASVAAVESRESTITIQRLDAQRVATVGVVLDDGIDVATVDTAVKAYVTPEKLKSYGLTENGVSYGGAFADFGTDYSRLQIVFILAMIAVYLILVYQFNSFWQPTMIMFTIPLALIGVFPGLVAVQSSINMVSGLGIVALIGIVVNNAIVLITTYNRFRRDDPNTSPTELLVRSGMARLQPIFATTITTIGGVLPITIFDPFWTGLGAALIAGLAFSTIGTLVFIPLFIEFTHRYRARREWKKTASPVVS